MAGPRATYPAVMSFAGLDPTGGAGLQADIEAVLSLGGQPLPVATTITAQDTRDVKSCTPVGPVEVVEQARAVLEDIPVQAFKIGLVGSAGNAQAIHAILRDYPDVPVVLDPVCASGAGTPLADDELIESLVTLLLPLTTIATPNSREAMLLARESDSVAACAHQLLSYGCGHVLVTGGDDAGPRVVNRLYSDMRLIEEFDFERLPHTFHGSGCTLSAALAALIAHGLPVLAAVSEAQQYTWEALSGGRRIGHGQHHPDRLFWARSRGEAGR